jgi:ABC-2 type transport system permease protein
VNEARIHEQGYRPYTGPRLGVSSAMTSLTVHGIQRVLGIKRRARAKIMPALTVLVAYVPAIALIGLVAFLGGLDVDDPADALPSYGEYYGFIGLAVLLFAAFVAPEVLCTDRRSGMLSLYLASPLTRDTYLLAKAAAVFAVLLVVTMGPPLLLLIAYTLQGAGPDGPIAFLELLVKIVLAGLAVTLVPAALSLGISSLTSRRAFASAGIVVAILASGVVVGVLTDPSGPDLPAILGLLDLFGLPFELALRIHGERGEGAPFADLGTGWVVAGNLAWTAGLAALARASYRRVSVDR